MRRSLYVLAVALLCVGGLDAKHRSRKAKVVHSRNAGTAVLSGISAGGVYFQPPDRLPGIGLGRRHMSESVLRMRTERMIKAQEFVILRHPVLKGGPERVTSPPLSDLIAKSARCYGLEQDLVEALVFLESAGRTDIESPSGAKGVMQIVRSTAKDIGLKIVTAPVKLVRAVFRKSRGKKVASVRNVPTKSTVVIDERLIPARAVDRGTYHLSRLAKTYGDDWGVFGYHCGEGCIQRIKADARRAEIEDATVAKVFFTGSPVFRRSLYEDVRKNMERDYSPTYWFRIEEARRLLRLFRNDPQSYERLFTEHRNPANPLMPLSSRWFIWYRQTDPEQAVPVPDNPSLYSFKPTSGMALSKKTAGALLYLAFETRRMWEAGNYRERYVPFKVAAQSGGVLSFAIPLQKLPTGESECLRFILNDLGWDDSITFLSDKKSFGFQQIAPNPDRANFFRGVYDSVQSR